MLCMLMRVCCAGFWIRLIDPDDSESAFLSAQPQEDALSKILGSTAKVSASKADSSGGGGVRHESRNPPDPASAVSPSKSRARGQAAASPGRAAGSLQLLLLRRPPVVRARTRKQHLLPRRRTSAHATGRVEATRATTRAKYLPRKQLAQRARLLSSAAADVPAMKKFTPSLHFGCFKFTPSLHCKLILVYTKTEIVQTSLHTVYT